MRAGSRYLIPAGLVCLALALAIACEPVGPAQDTVSGTVVDENGSPLPGATVRIQATTNNTLSGADGAFTLGGLAEGVTVTVSAWKDSYYCAKV